MSDELLKQLYPENWEEEAAKKAERARRHTAASLATYARNNADSQDDFGIAEMLGHNKQTKPRKKKRKVEAPIQARIIKALKKHGAVNVEKTGAGRIPVKRNGKTEYIFVGNGGKADIHCVYRNIRFALEVKVPKTETTKKTYASKVQKAYLNRFANNGGCSAVVRSVDDAIKVLIEGKIGEVVMW